MKGRRPVRSHYKEWALSYLKTIGIKSLTISRLHVKKVVKSYVEAINYSRKEPISQGGYYVEPTIIEGLEVRLRVNQEEIFGPVVTIQPFETEEEAVSVANSTEYGLAATVWTNDLKKSSQRSCRTRHGNRVGQLLVTARPTHSVRRSEKLGCGTRGGIRSTSVLYRTQNVCINFSKLC